MNQFCSNRNTRTGEITDIEGLKRQDCKEKKSRKRGRRGKASRSLEKHKSDTRRKQRRNFIYLNRQECCAKRLEKNDKVHCAAIRPNREIHV